MSAGIRRPKRRTGRVKHHQVAIVLKSQTSARISCGITGPERPCRAVIDDEVAVALHDHLRAAATKRARAPEPRRILIQPQLAVGLEPENKTPIARRKGLAGYEALIGEQ